MKVDLNEILNGLNSFAYIAKSNKSKWISEFVGEAIEVLTGYKDFEFTKQKKDWLDVIHPDDKERVLKESEVLAFPPTNIIQEYRVCHKEGYTFWVRDIKQSFKKNGILIISGIVHNIDQQKKIEEKNKILLDQMIRKNNQFQELLHSIHSINEQIQNENSLVKQTVLLKIEKDILPTLEKIKTNRNTKIIEDLSEKLLSIFNELPEIYKSNILTQKESEISALVQSGMTQKDIALEINLSIDTVKSHVKNIKKKLNISKDMTLYEGLKVRGQS